MITAVALVPGTALLVPGVAGRHGEVMGAIREAAVAAVSAVLDTGVHRVVVVAPGGEDRHLVDRWTASLGSVGVAESFLAWPMPTWAPARVGARAPSPDAGAPIVSAIGSAALALVTHVAGAGCLESLEILEVREAIADQGEGADRARQLRRLGRELARSEQRASGAVGLVVAGCLSARNGPSAPRAHDDRAPAVDRAIAADLTDGGPAARARLAAVPEQLAASLGISGWAPWQVMVGACGPAVLVAGGATATDGQLGVEYLVTSWRLLEPTA